MIDAHCHIHYQLENNEKNTILDILNHAQSKNITTLLNNIEIDTSTNIFQVISQVNEINKNNLKIYYAAGVHPLSVEKIGLEEARQNIIHNINDLIAVGETGIDYSRNVPKDLQLEFLKMHGEICQKYNKPIIIHLRDGPVDDVLEVLKDFNIPIMFHCTVFDKYDLEKALKYNTIMSFSGLVTFKSKTESIIETLKMCPLDRILIETDSPFLAPVPKRGKINEPAFIEHTYEKVAEIKGISLPELKIKIQENFNKFFFSIK